MITHQVAEITPTLAEVLLTRNPGNRRISRRHVEWLAGAMERGEWVRNGESIKLDEDGNLIDGQHRLAACVKSGVTITADMVTGLPRDVQLTQDVGRPRRSADFLKMRGVKYSKIVASIARRLYTLESGGAVPDNRPKPTQQQVDDILNRWPGIEQAAEDSYAMQRITGRLSIVGLFAVMARRADRERAEQMLESMATGSMLPANHPILVCRNLIISHESRRARVKDVQIWTYLVRCWNDLCEGVEHRTLYRYIEGGEVPKMKGIVYGKRL